MSRDLKYKVRFESDLSGLTRATAATGRLRVSGTSALDAMAARGGAAQAAFHGVEAAARGNMYAVFGLSRAVKALIASFGPFTAIIAILSAAFMVLQKLTDKYNEQSEASKKAADEAKDFSESLKALRAREQEAVLSLDSHVAALKDLCDQYQKAAADADQFTEAQKKMNAVLAAAATAAVGIRESRALSGAVGKPVESAAISLAAERERASISNQAKLNDLLADRAALEQKAAVAGAGIAGLSAQLAPAPEVGAQFRKVWDLMDQREGLRQDSKAYIAVSNEIESQRNAYMEIRKQDEERIAGVKKLISEQQALRIAALSELDLMDERENALALEHDALREKLDLQEKINSEQAKELARQAELKQAKLDLNRAAEQARQAAAANEEDDAEIVRNLKEDEAAAAQTAANAARAAADPEYAKQLDRQERKRQHLAREAARMGVEVGADDTAEDLERKTDLARALAARARGVRSSRHDRIIAAEEARKAAQAAKAAREQAEKDQAANIKASAEHLKQINEKMDALALA